MEIVNRYGVTIKIEPLQANKLTQTEIYKMNRQQQTDLLIKLGAQDIPEHEIDRVKLILELQK